MTTFEDWHNAHAKYMEPADIAHWCRDAYEAGSTSRDVEIESLRQQLVDMTAERDRLTSVVASWIRANSPDGWIDDMRQQLADHIKREVMLRDAIKPFTEGCWSRDLQVHTREALAATVNLDGLILCHAEQVAFLNPYGGVLQTLTTGLEKSTFTTPLYLAWEPK